MKSQIVTSKKDSFIDDEYDWLSSFNEESEEEKNKIKDKILWVDPISGDFYYYDDDDEFNLCNKDIELPKETKNCNHKWKTTFGLFNKYEDCTICGIKKENL